MSSRERFWIVPNLGADSAAVEELPPKISSGKLKEKSDVKA